MGFMKIIATLFMLGLLSACAAQKPETYAYDLPGPTKAERIPSGYSLQNKHLQVVIDSVSGDVVYFGKPDQKLNLLDQPVRIVNDGYVEARDEQTWQYMGEDAKNHFTWRKIYCLDGDHLNISILCKNDDKQ